MKKPNKIERMNAYLYAWAILTGRVENPIANKPYDILVCVCIATHYGISSLNDPDFFMDTPDELLEEMFPEWYAQRPDNYDWDEWWPINDRKSRITAIENAIKLLCS